MGRAMLTAIVAADRDAIALRETLAALVPAAVNGLIRRAIVVAPEPAAEGIDALVEASGADRVVGAGDALALWRAGLARAAPGWRLCLVAGMTPVGEWDDAVARHLARPAPPDAAFGLAGGVGARLAAAAARRLGRPCPAAGLLTRATEAKAAGLARLPARLEDRRPRS